MIGLYQLIFLTFIVCVVGILIGFKFAVHIYNPVLYALFWVMYFITALCLASLLTSLFFYDSIKQREGPKGQQGERGEEGNQGDTGVCDNDCRDDIFYVELMTYSEKLLNGWEKSDFKPIQISNKYWKDRISMIVKSKEFTNLMNVKGRDHVLDYLKKILKVWLEMIYKEGGRPYFESIGAENEFEWRKTNPWNEIKQYDVYYWGMRKDMRIRTFSKCRPKLERDMTPRLKVIKSDHYEGQIWADKHNLGRSDSHRNWWRPKVLHKDGREAYHPVGDVLVQGGDNHTYQRSKHHRGHIRFDGGYHTGPSEKTIVVAGSATKPATNAYALGTSYYKYCADFLCRLTGYRIGKKRKSHIEYWRLQCPSGYKALGDVAMPSGPGGSKPNYRNYRCIHEDCLEPVNKGAYMAAHPDGSRECWKSGGSENEHYSLFHANQKGRGDNATFYKIKEDCLTVKEVPGESDPVYNKGWYPNPSNKDKKYSVMNYMALPTNATLINIGNPKISITVNLVPNSKKFNLYYVRYNSENYSGKNNEITLEAISPNILKWRSIVKDYKKDSLRWVINMDETRKGQMTIMSKPHNKYLRYVNNGDVKLVHHNSMDDYGYWKLHA